MDWFMTILIAGLLGLLGGLLHIVIPPYEGEWKSALRRLFAGFFIGAVMGATILPDPSTFQLPSTEVAAYLTALITSGYVAIDLIKQMMEKPAE